MCDCVFRWNCLMKSFEQMFKQTGGGHSNRSSSTKNTVLLKPRIIKVFLLFCPDIRHVCLIFHAVTNQLIISLVCVRWILTDGFLLFF